MTPEGRVKAMVNKALATLPRKYKFMPVQNGMGMPGLDFYNCVNGWFIAIETKTTNKKLTGRQKLTADEITNAGGVVFVIRDQSDVDYMMGTLKKGFIIQGEIHDKCP